jgi:uncharacterized protein (DUF2237 family)
MAGLHLLVVAALLFSVSGYQSVKGGALQDCSVRGEATTGYLRNNKCAERNDDLGSHHICIKMEQDFCETTGQGDWCTTHKDPFTGNGIGHWCVCQWAFARYLKSKGDCSAFKEVKCEATNMEARKAYESNPSMAQAAECLRKKCGYGKDQHKLRGQVGH